MKIALIQIGKTNEKYISDGVDEYSGRIRKYSGFEINTIPDLKNTRNMPVAEQKLKEGIFGTTREDIHAGKEESRFCNRRVIWFFRGSL